MSHYDPASGREQRDGADSETNPSYVSPKPAATGAHKWVETYSSDPYEEWDYTCSKCGLKCGKFNPPCSVPTPPASQPTVTRTRDEELDELATYIALRLPEYMPLRGDRAEAKHVILTLLRAAETRKVEDAAPKAGKDGQK